MNWTEDEDRALLFAVTQFRNRTLQQVCVVLASELHNRGYVLRTPAALIRRYDRLVNPAPKPNPRAVNPRYSTPKQDGTPVDLTDEDQFRRRALKSDVKFRASMAACGVAPSTVTAPGTLGPGVAPRSSESGLRSANGWVIP